MTDHTCTKCGEQLTKATVYNRALKREMGHIWKCLECHIDFIGFDEPGEYAPLATPEPKKLDMTAIYGPGMDDYGRYPVVDHFKPLRNHNTCYYCKLSHQDVEAGGVYHCPNRLCTGPGQASSREKTLDSFKVDGNGYTIDPRELIDMVKAAPHFITEIHEAELRCLPFWEKQIDENETK